jgi:D-xylose transport system permease protein
LAGTFLPPVVGWDQGAVVVFAYAAMTVSPFLSGGSGRRARARGHGVPPRLRALSRVLVLAAVTATAVATFNANRGTPLAVLVFLAVVAAGGPANRDPRRSRETHGVLPRVPAAAAGGILGASRLLAVNQSSGSTDLALSAVAAAAIGGASLYGGRGSAWSALVGALVVGSMANGMDLLGVPQAARFVANAVVLVAVGLDTISRRSHGEPVV